MTAVVALGLAAFVMLAVWLHERSNLRIANAHMADRAPLTAGEFGRHYFPQSQAPIATRLRELLAELTPVGLDQLHPEDRPIQDLQIDELDSLAVVEFVLAIEKEYGISLPVNALENARTFRDVVMLVHACVA
jgi:acyl carrier protein